MDEPAKKTALRTIPGAGVKQTPEGRADDPTLTLEDLGDKVFYGG